MHFSARKNDELLLQHLPVGTNIYGCCAFSYMMPTVWNKVAEDNHNAPSVMSFRKQSKTHYFQIILRSANDCTMSCSEIF